MGSLGLRTLRRWFQQPEREPYRTVEVHPPSRADEGGWLFLAAGFVLLAVIYTYGFEREASRGVSAAAGSSSGLLPYQVLFRDLPSSEQRTFRAMQEGVGEAVRARGQAGSWPSADALAADGVPPFAPDVLDKAGMHWSGRRDGLFANYLGAPSAGAAAPAFLIFVQEPDPVTGEKPPPPSVVDEEHQLLSDGTLLHVTYWKRSAAGLRGGFIIDPAIEGWEQIRISTPLEEMAKNEGAE
jgi:hypothetical protein